MFFKRSTLLLASLWAKSVLADVGFALDGAIQGATATDGSFNTGGFLSANGWKVIVPKNTQVQFPAAWVPWKDFVASYGAGLFDNFEINVMGNVVPGKGAIAGTISIAQFLTQGSQGTISKVNFDGSIQIENGPTIRINDPNAKYSVGFTGNPFMQADDENPSISSWGGFPMCVPRSSSDPLCPSSNRPGNKQGVFNAPDPLSMAPFLPGDYVEYSGYVRGGEVICYEITAINVQINSGADFGFIRMEDCLIGTWSTDPNAESGQTKFIGYTSEASGSPVKVAAVDLDPCTGAETFRDIASGSIKAGDVRNKFEIRWQGKAGDKYAREYLVTTSTGEKLMKSGIRAGHYIQPVTEWIQPELAVPGAPAVAFEFKDMNFLTQGLGADDNGNIWGPLDPFPQSGVKVFDVSTCPKVVPTPSSSPTPTGTATTPSGTATSTASATPTPTIDTVRLTQATWVSQGGGTVSITCTSNNTNSTLVQMTVDLIGGKNGDQLGLAMTASNTAGTWTYGGKVKQPTSATCKSKLKGTASGPVR